MKNLSGRLLALAITVALVLVAVPGFAAVTHTGAGVAKITVITETNAQTTSSTSYVPLPGATATITVPALKTQLVNVRFSAESYCFGSTSLSFNWCSVAVFADGVEMLPNSNFDFAFDANGNADDAWEGHAMERTAVLGPGTHTISLQWAVTNAGVTFRLDDWTMAITQYSNGH